MTLSEGDTVNKPFISLVIPVYNEEAVLEILYQRLFDALDKLDRRYEVIFINDGSRDKSIEILENFHQRRPDQVRVIDFNGNFGQHMAIMAGFEHVRGELVITMDADLQNPPEEIYKIVEAFEKGHDVVNAHRLDRQDKHWRKTVSKGHNWLRSKMMPGLDMKDEGCMLRGYSRRIVDLMASTGESNTFIPALALTYAGNPAEVGISHEERAAGTSNYTFYKLIRYNFDLITNFSLVPLQAITFVGILVSAFSFIFFIFLAARRIFLGPDAQGVFTLFAILFFLVGIMTLSLGIIGEYIGRIYQEVRKRPRFVIHKIIQKGSE